MSILEKANDLEKMYPKLNFRNHCYLRIAYDNVVQAKWDTILERPFISKANLLQITQANELLESYRNNIELLLEHNLNSLCYRNKTLQRIYI